MKIYYVTITLQSQIKRDSLKKAILGLFTLVTLTVCFYIVDSVDSR